ncbi:MAG: acyltransferase family protein [Lachnospiraceae bacterium]|nr:acyltransferase family protein [Lachnospiraceae bacterium]
MSTVNTKDRIEYLDIAKGIGIIIVVWFHARGPFHSYFSLFFMPLFFLISGYLYNPNNTLSNFIKRKFLSLYVPFVFWNLCFLFLRSLNGFSLSHTIRFTLKVLLTLDKDGDYLGAIWFLGALFTESVLYKVLDTFLSRWRYRRTFITVVFCLRAVFAFRIDLPYRLSRTLILGMFFAIGYLIREQYAFFLRFHTRWSVIATSIAFLLIGTLTEHTMGDNEYSSAPLFVIGALAGSYLTICLSKWIESNPHPVMRKCKNLCCYLSRNSIDIVIWQFVCFRIAIAIQLIVYHLPITDVLKYGNRFDTNGGWWILYLITGLFVPILWANLLRSGIWGKYLKKYHIMR